MATYVDSLTQFLRLKIGDTNPATYRYMDEWLEQSLILSIKSLSRWWKNKYTVTDAGLISSDLEDGDDYIIVLMASLIILEGSLENSAWSTVSWKDQEISFSNLESGRLRDSNLKRIKEELELLLLPPVKRLATARKNSLSGYKKNSYETEGDY
jgi:hypothetical protein